MATTAEDEELRRVIALSLLEAQKKPLSSHSASESDDDDNSQFERDMRAAMEASKAEVAASGSRAANWPELVQSKATSSSSNASAFLSERAQLEIARLERQKRMHGQTGKVDDPGPPQAKRQRPPPSSDRTNSAPSTSHSGRSAPSYAAQDQLFGEGTLRQTANKHVDPKKDLKPTFRLSEVIGPQSEISFAILSSYALQLSWIYGFFDPRTPVILVAQPGEDGKSSIKNVLPNWVKTTPFLRNGRGCMHIKFLLIFYKTGRLRVVIPTANFVDFDWRDIENTVWLQDIPLRETPIKHDPRATDFPATLQRVLHSINVPDALASHIGGDHPNLPLQSVNELRTRWDWAQVRVRLVASIAGRHVGWPDVLRTGHTALMKAVRDVGARAGASRETLLECQGSSVGTYSTQWMNEFHCSARGDSAEDWLDVRKARRTELPYPPIRVIFPSLQTVKDSVLGLPGAGTMFCRKSQWEAKAFPRDQFHDSRSKRGRVLMHSKMIVATFKNTDKSKGKDTGKGKGKRVWSPDSEDEDVVEIPPPVAEGADTSVAGWAYVGSHNFTPSAWGTLSGSAFTPVLNITNFELGIVFPLVSEKEADDVACWERPARKYNFRDRPWIQEEALG